MANGSRRMKVSAAGERPPVAPLAGNGRSASCSCAGTESSGRVPADNSHAITPTPIFAATAIARVTWTPHTGISQKPVSIVPMTAPIVLRPYNRAVVVPIAADRRI